MSKTKIAVAVIINLLLIALALKSINAFLSYRQYTLYENGKWENKKTSLIRGVPGAWSMMLTKPAIARNTLNISDWAGYHELIYKNVVPFKKFSFTSASFHHPFSCILSKTDSLTQGIWFNYKGDTCCFFIADNHGRFLHKQDFSDNNALDNSKRNLIETERNNDSVLVKINDHPIATAYLPLPPLVHIGFRGDRSDKGVALDDIVVTDASNKVVLSEDFAPPFSFHWITLVALLLLSVSFFFLLKPRHTLYTLYLNTVLAFGLAAAYFIYFNYLSDRHLRTENYFHFLDINWQGARSTFEFKKDVSKRLNREYPLQNIAGIKPVILFIGSSQTWGAGVTDSSNAMPALVEKDLRAHFSDSSITVINCGIPGIFSDSLFAFYRDEWSAYLPKAVVINLSLNDKKDTAIFRKNIRAFIRFNNLHHIKTLLIREPLDTPTLQLIINHNIMREEGARGNVPVADVQTYMDAHKDSGFMWWDFVHCTDYGYQVLAASISPPLIDLLETEKLIPARKVPYPKNFPFF